MPLTQPKFTTQAREEIVGLAQADALRRRRSVMACFPLSGLTTLGSQMTRLPARQTLLLIMVPLLATFLGQRLYLHFVGVHHVRANGLIIHHLFFGVMLVIPAAFVLAFTPRQRLVSILARVGLGIGSAMVLDEIVYLVATQASDGDYVSALSLRGAVIFISLAVFLLLALFRLHCNNDQTDVK